jgi:hypothetical protein
MSFTEEFTTEELRAQVASDIHSTPEQIAQEQAKTVVSNDSFLQALQTEKLINTIQRVGRLRL